ncbi:hypothetical protein Pcac1_g16875 [Phytophthora cactorum]|nr:hypothetical protein Pcac1_g16875 [Phytophthora cactorum]
MYSPLLSVELVLNHQEDAAALQDLGPVIADFLGPVRNLSLHDACHIGSFKLLDWIWRVSRYGSSSRTSSWSITSYLQSNRHYYQWQFSESLEIAADRGDLKVVKRLMERFKDCEVAVEVVEAAAKNGHLEVLQILLENDVEGMKMNNTITGKGNIRGHKVHWGGSSLIDAVENGHSEVVHWLCQYKTHGCGEARITSAIKTALRVGDMKLAKFLLPQGKCILDYAEFCSHPDIIEWKLDCGYFLRDTFSAGAAIKYLVRSGRLDLMQRIAEQQDPPPEDSDWSTDWRCAMVLACDDRLFSELIFSAAYKGSIDVMEYLFERGAVDKVRDSLMHAIREDHSDLVKWLINHFPVSERIPNYCVMDEAARYGRLEMLQYFQDQDVSVISGFFPSVNARRVRNSSGEKYMTQMFVPASDDYLKWLYVNRFEGCTQKAIEGSLSNGHLRVAEWLHSHLPSLIPASVELWRRPANLFEMLLFQYRHFSFSPSLVEYAKEILMDASSKSNHKHIVAWLRDEFPAAP